ncbi:FAH family protein [Streptomyces platensis]|uniref:FAH family protein n=1 Tax=Streptomyces platensis TaxID=58346 RepID=UPI00386B01F2|nr:FAH family protein [Streptomyces platensis]
MTVLFECTYDNERRFGLGVPQDDTDLRLYALGSDQLSELIAESGGDADALTAGREPLDVRAEHRHQVRMLPPLMPEHVGDALVSGFMMTHNVKADASTPEQPNWFVKGLGDALKLAGEPLSIPGDAVAVCEEAEVVLLYVGDEKTGRPVYVGHGFGNDVTDIGRFKRHNGHLSYAKLCDAAISPALHVGPPPARVTGETTIERDGAVVWSGPFTTGTEALFYDLDTIMSTLMDYEALHRPGRVHYVFIGADRSSFHAGHEMANGDRVMLDFASHGVTLANRLVWGGRQAGA